MAPQINSGALPKALPEARRPPHGKTRCGNVPCNSAEPIGFTLVDALKLNTNSSLPTRRVRKPMETGVRHCRLTILPRRSALTAAILLACLSSDAVRAAQADPGSQVYLHSGCFACHGELGYGGAGPRFRGDKLLSADQYVVGQILLGRGIMPSFADRLSDSQIAEVATYIRTSWGNDFGAVSPDQVAQIRQALNPEAPAGSSQRKRHGEP